MSGEHRHRHRQRQVKGGLTVLTNGIRAFLPGSLVDMRPIKDTRRSKARRWNSRSSSSIASATTSWCRVARSSRRRMGEDRQGCWRTSRRARSSRVWSRTSPITVRSWISVASTACCTSPTWRGAACSHPAKSCRSARKSSQGPQVRSGKEPRFAGRQAAGRGSLGRHGAPLSAGHTPVR